MGSFYYGVLRSALLAIKSQQNISKKEKHKNLALFLANEETQIIAKKTMHILPRQKVIVLLIRLRLTFILLKLYF